MADDRYKLGSFYRTRLGAFIQSPMGARGAPVPFDPWRGPILTQGVYGDTGLILKPGIYPPIFPNHFSVGNLFFTIGQQWRRLINVMPPVTEWYRYTVNRLLGYIDVPDRPINSAELSFKYGGYGEETSWNLLAYKSINCVTNSIDDYNFTNLGLMGSKSNPGRNMIDRNGYFEEGSNQPHWDYCHEIKLPLIASKIVPGERLFIAMVCDIDYIYGIPPPNENSSSGQSLTTTSVYLLIDGDQKYFT